jgi:hypothetical protein
MISSIVLFFRRDSCGAGPTLDAANGVEMEAPKPPAAAGAVEVVFSFSAPEVAGAVSLVACVVFGANRLGEGADVVIPGAEVVADEVVMLDFPILAKRDDVWVGAEPDDVVGVAPPKRLGVGAGAVVAGVDELELAILNGFGDCVAVNGDDTVPVDVKLNVGLGAVAEDVDGPLLSAVAGFVVFSPLKRPAPLAEAVLLGTNVLLDDALVLAGVPNKLLDCVVAGLVTESKALRPPKRLPEED